MALISRVFDALGGDARSPRQRKLLAAQEDLIIACNVYAPGARGAANGRRGNIRPGAGARHPSGNCHLSLWRRSWSFPLFRLVLTMVARPGAWRQVAHEPLALASQSVYLSANP